MGTFTAGKSDIRIENGGIRIIKDGPHIKFKKNVDHITFSGENSLDKGRQNVLYITERAVFRLQPEGPVLIEIAPGANLQKDILDKMEFTPHISENLKLMDTRLFINKPMGIILK